MEFNLGVILATVVNFLILFFGLKYFFFEKVKLIVEARENEISQKLDSADEEVEKVKKILEKTENQSLQWMLIVGRDNEKNCETNSVLKKFSLV